MATFYSQNDPRWKDIVVRKGLTIGQSTGSKPVGCLLDALSYPLSIISGFDITPDMLLAYAKSHSLIDLKGYLKFAIIEQITGGKLKYYPSDPGYAKFILAEVKFGEQHFVGYRKSDNTIRDPWDGKQKDAKSYFAKYPVISWRYLK
jgi:hypothetical protein